MHKAVEIGDGSPLLTAHSLPAFRICSLAASLRYNF